MREVVAELKALRLHGMAQRYEELLAEPGSGIQSAGWLIQCLLEAEVTDRHVRSIRYQMGAAKSRCIGTWPVSTSANHESMRN